LTFHVIEVWKLLAFTRVRLFAKSDC